MSPDTGGARGIPPSNTPNTSHRLDRLRQNLDTVPAPPHPSRHRQGGSPRIILPDLTIPYLPSSTARLSFLVPSSDVSLTVVEACQNNDSKHTSPCESLTLLLAAHIESHHHSEYHQRRVIAARIALADSLDHKRVDPSTSVRRNVTVPVGRANACSGNVTPTSPQRYCRCSPTS